MPYVAKTAPCMVCGWDTDCHYSDPPNRRSWVCQKCFDEMLAERTDKIIWRESRMSAREHSAQWRGLFLVASQIKNEWHWTVAKDEEGYRDQLTSVMDGGLGLTPCSTLELAKQTAELVARFRVEGIAE